MGDTRKGQSEIRRGIRGSCFARGVARRLLRALAAVTLTGGLVVSLGGAAPAVAAAATTTCDASWQIVSSRNVDTGNSILFATSATSATDVWAVGYFDDTTSLRTLTEHWDGTVWRFVASPVAGNGSDILDSVASVAPDDAWAVGSHQPFGGRAQTLGLHWDGSQWHLVSIPSPGQGDNRLLGVAAVSSRDVWAVGSAAGGSRYQKALIQHWNGRAWDGTPAPHLAGDATLSDVAVVSADDVWAVGTLVSQNDASDATSQTLVLHWDGSAWSTVQSPNPSTDANGLTGVTAISASDVWAVGTTVTDSATLPLALHWDGRSWTQTTTFDPASSSAAFTQVTARGANDVWAVGSYDGPHSISHLTLVEHWDGTAWQMVASVDARPRSYNALTDVTWVPSYGLWATGFYTGVTKDRTLTERVCPTP